jgi:hypothetical protein
MPFDLDFDVRPHWLSRLRKRVTRALTVESGLRRWKGAPSTATSVPLNQPGCGAPNARYNDACTQTAVDPFDTTGLSILDTAGARPASLAPSLTGSESSDPFASDNGEQEEEEDVVVTATISESTAALLARYSELGAVELVGSRVNRSGTTRRRLAISGVRVGNSCAICYEKFVVGRTEALTPCRHGRVVDCLNLTWVADVVPLGFIRRV